MWRLLRDRRLQGLKFRRQFPVGPFVTDFCCYDLRLIIELDGEVHANSHQAAHDENRDLFFESLGYETVRIPNRRVFEAPDTVLEEIVGIARRRGFTGD